MEEFIDILPELEFELGEVFKPEIDQILLYFHNEKVQLKIIYEEDSGIETEERDLSFIVENDGPMLSVKYSLETNYRILMGSNTMTKMVALHDLITEEGAEKIINELD